MSNHFHILIRVIPEYKLTDDEILKRYVDFYGDERVYAEGLVPSLRLKLSNLSEFMREIKVNFSRFYDRRHNRRGYFWGDRFKSVIVENGETLINCQAYIDLNPLRAGLVERPEQYRWNSLGYHVRTNNWENFLSTDFGLKEFNVKSKKERIRRYRRYVYEAGSLNQPQKGNIKVIEDKMLERERGRDFELSRSDRFKYRTRYFTDSGIIGSEVILLNLGANAADALGDKSGVLTFRIQKYELDTGAEVIHPDLHAGRYIKISVADNGPGIPKEMQDRI